MNGTFTLFINLTYKDVYGTNHPTFEELFIGIPTNAIFEVISHFNSLLHFDGVDLEAQEKIFRTWTSRIPKANYKLLLDAVNGIKNRTGGKVILFTPVGALSFLEKALSHFHEGSDREFTPDEELRILKAYLLSCQGWVEESNAFTDRYRKINTDLDAIEFILPMHIRHFEILNTKDFRFAIYKSLSFFNFVDQDEVLGSLLNQFLNKFKCESWLEFLLALVKIYSIRAKSGTNASTIMFKNPDPKITAILDELTLKPNSFKVSKDFLYFREFPVFKTDENSYSMFHFNFLVDKLFQGLLFDFGKIAIKNAISKDIPDFKSKYYSKSFTEEFLFYNLLSYLIGRRNIYKLDGKEIANLLGEESIDYYVRSGTKMFLFEFKDVLMAAKAKTSYNSESIINDINVKLVKNDKGRPKGIGQLINFINILNNPENSVDTYSNQDLKVYPILVITDSSYDSFGVNWVIIEKFRSLIESSSFRFKVMDPIIINIDTLIMLQDEIHDRKVVCADAINEYLNFIHESHRWSDKFLSFSQFVIRYLNKRSITIKAQPRFILNEIINKLKNEN